jgi:hypothetical protein
LITKNFDSAPFDFYAQEHVYLHLSAYTPLAEAICLKSKQNAKLDEQW